MPRTTRSRLRVPTVGRSKRSSSDQNDNLNVNATSGKVERKRNNNLVNDGGVDGGGVSNATGSKVRGRIDRRQSVAPISSTRIASAQVRDTAALAGGGSGAASRRRSSSRGSSSNEFSVGCRVSVVGRGRGIVRFFGPIPSKGRGNWAGVELDGARGDCDGSLTILDNGYVHLMSTSAYLSARNGSYYHVLTHILSLSLSLHECSDPFLPGPVAPVPRPLPRLAAVVQPRRYRPVEVRTLHPRNTRH